MARRTAGRRRAARGFSLVEVALVIGIIALLIGLALPMLASARESAHAARSVSNLRQLAAGFGAYTADFQTYPFGEEGRWYSASWTPSHGVGMTVSHWEFALHWPLLTRAHTPWDEFWGVFRSPASRGDDRFRGRLPIPHYVYSNSFIARPQLWSGNAEPDTRLLRPVRPGDVTHPSAKVLMWDSVTAYLLRPQPMEEWHNLLVNPTPMLFADGHVAQRRPPESTEPVVNPLYDFNAQGWMRLHNTRNGVHGRDFE